MTTSEIKKRRLQIAVEMSSLAHKDIALRQEMMEIEAQSAALNHELAELDLEEFEIGTTITVTAHGRSAS